MITQRRLEYLMSLPEGYDASSLPSAPPAKRR
jgi:hypothetical protein